MRSQPNIKEIVVHFYKAEAGRLHFSVKAGEEKFNGWFSAVWDPLPHFKAWLESIALGAQQTSFEYDAEGPDFHFDYNGSNIWRKMLTISEVENKVFIHAEIEPRQMVKAFYLGILNFTSSEKYNPVEYEREYLKERMCSITGLDEDAIVEILVEMDRVQLGVSLFNADPQYEISFPSAKDKNEEFKLFYETSVEQKELPPEHTMKSTARQFLVPENFDFWTEEKKRDFVIQTLNQTTRGSHDGMKIQDFRSKIIENYLG